MEHPAQNAMLFPASYAVLSDEEMTYLEGGTTIPLFQAFGYQVSLDTDTLATFALTASANLFVLMTNYSFQYLTGRLQSGLENGLSLSGTFYHNWDKMNSWSKVASVGVAGLAGIYVYSQVKSLISSVKTLYDQIVNPMPTFATAQADPAAQTAAA